VITVQQHYRQTDGQTDVILVASARHAAQLACNAKNHIFVLHIF